MAEISLKQLQAFAEVAKLGSFKGAAIALNTTQPNISSRISKLEEQLGQVLMERDAGSVRLTPVGHELLGNTHKILDALDDLLVSAQNPKLFEGVMRLGVTETIAHSWLGNFLNRFSELFQHVTVDLMVDLSANLTSALQSGEIDLAFQSGPFGLSTTHLTDLGSVPIVWVASPELAIPEGVLDPGILSRFLILPHARNTTPYQQLDRHFADLRQSVRLVPSTSQAACLHMTLQGIGIACLPLTIVKNALKAGTLRHLDYQWEPDPLVFEARALSANSPHFVSEAVKLARAISMTEHP